MWRWAFNFVVISFLIGCGGSGGSSSTANGQASLASSFGNTPNSDDLETTLPSQFPEAEIALDFPLSGSLAIADKISFAGNISGIPDGQEVEIRLTNGATDYRLKTQYIVGTQWLIEDVSLTVDDLESVKTFDIEMFIDDVMLDSLQTELAVDPDFVSFGVGDALAVNDDLNTAYLADDFRVVSIDLSSGERDLILDLTDQISHEIAQLVWIKSTHFLVLRDEIGTLLVFEGEGDSWQSVSLEALPTTATSIAASPFSDGLIVYQSQASTLIEYDAFLVETGSTDLSGSAINADSILAFSADEIMFVSAQGLNLVNLHTESVRSTSFAAESWTNIDAVTAGASSDELYIRDAGSNALWRVRIDLSGSSLPQNDLDYVSELVDLNGIYPYSLSYFEGGEGILFSDSNRLSRLSFDTLEVSHISEANWGSGEQWIAPWGLTLEKSETSDADVAYAYVSDIARDNILQIDLSTGDRQTLSRDGVSMKAVSGIVQGEGSIYGVDWAQKTVLSTDMITGFTSQLDDQNVTEAGLAEPIAIDLDSDQYRVFVLDRGLGAICEVDTLNGSSSVLVDRQTVPSLALASDLVFDASSQKIYWTSWLDNSVHSLNLNSFESSLVSGSNRGAGESLGRPQAIAIAANKGLLYTFNGMAGEIHAIEIDTGNREVITDSVPIAGTTSMTYDETRGALMVLDSAVGALYALYPETGDLALLSM